MDITKESPRLLSVCPGILGLERGIIRAIGSVRTLAYVEIEAFAIENILVAMEQGFLAPAPVWSNLKTFDVSPFSRNIDLLIGGYPCQPFSNAGKRLGADDPRHLWPYLRNIIAAGKPKRCFFENVPGHLTMGFEQVVQDLCELGYPVEAGLFSAAEVGQSHTRKRLFIMADSNDSRPRTSAAYPAGQSETAEGTAWSTDRERVRHVTRNGSSSVAGVGHTRLQIGGIELTRNEQQAAKRSGIIARPGQQQHDHEEPRSIESRMGCTVNGYNFREDFLRALGNSVVEQTAELAYRTLSNKHLNHDTDKNILGCRK